MRPFMFPVPVIVIGICFYWWSRMNNNLAAVEVIQPLITILCIVTAFMARQEESGDKRIFPWIAAGLFLALAGDFLNIDMTDPFVVMRGLVIAVIAYLTYAVGMTRISGFHRKDIPVGLAALVLYGAMMVYLWPYLGSMRIPGLVYGLVLPFTVTRGISTFFGTAFTRRQAAFLTAGTAMLYLTDIEFALNAYTGKVPMVLGPFLYSGGQLMMALSVYRGELKKD